MAANKNNDDGCSLSSVPSLAIFKLNDKFFWVLYVQVANLLDFLVNVYGVVNTDQISKGTYIFSKTEQTRWSHRSFEGAGYFNLQVTRSTDNHACVD